MTIGMMGAAVTGGPLGAAVTGAIGACVDLGRTGASEGEAVVGLGVIFGATVSSSCGGATGVIVAGAGVMGAAVIGAAVMGAGVTGEGVVGTTGADVAFGARVMVDGAAGASWRDRLVVKDGVVIGAMIDASSFCCCCSVSCRSSC